MIKQEDIQSIIETARIEEVVGDYVNLKKRGINLLGLCPFHNEKTPSFTVSPVKGIYKCFGCGKAGNAVKGDCINLGCTNTLMLSHKHLVAGIGLEDLLVVETADAILVAKKGESQKVKELVVMQPRILFL